MPFRAHLTRTHKEKVQLAMEVCAYLNELLEAEPETINRLMACSVLCGVQLINHPTVQVEMSGRASAHIRLLGVINGLVGVDEDQWGYVTALYEDNGELRKFVLTPRRGTERVAGIELTAAQQAEVDAINKDVDEFLDVNPEVEALLNHGKVEEAKEETLEGG